MPPSTPDPKQRFSETAKFLPVAFVVCNISGLYLIYMLFHAAPRLEDFKSSHRAFIETIIFNVVTALLVTCYVRCILEHPGTVPEKDEDPSWQYVPQDSRDGLGASLQETKRTGDRRHCKWCAKYKPDRCHHCRVCRMCILKMDHHCPWIYNCVGFRNHKYFFLLLFYATIDCHLIVWTMAESVKDAVENNIRFMTMFLLLFGETLAAFIGVLVTAFFGFHIWLMLKAMTTIEFCEKSLKRTGYDSSVYDRGVLGNICSVLGDNVFLWLLPTSTPSGRGLEFYTEEQPLARDAETAKASKREKKAAKSYGGYGSAAPQASSTPGPSPRPDPFRGLDSPQPASLPSTPPPGGEDAEPAPEPMMRPK